jgi:C4-dicarboxylate transporter DctQ subunit
MVLIIFINVLLRYLFREPVYWAEEVAKYFMVWIALVGAQVALKKGLHVGLKFFVDRFPSFISNWITVVVKLLILFFLFFMLKEGLDLAIFASNQRFATLNISLIWVYIAVPVAAFLMIVTVLNLLIKDIQKRFPRDFRARSIH